MNFSVWIVASILILSVLIWIHRTDFGKYKEFTGKRISVTSKSGETFEGMAIKSPFKNSITVKLDDVDQNHKRQVTVLSHSITDIKII